MAIGRADGIWEALMRSTWSAADLAKKVILAGTGNQKQAAQSVAQKALDARFRMIRAAQAGRLGTEQ